MTEPPPRDGAGAAQRAARVALVALILTFIVLVGLMATLVVRNAGAVSDAVIGAIGPLSTAADGDQPIQTGPSPPLPNSYQAEDSNPHPALPVGSPADWFSDEEYPPSAKRAGAQGRVGVLLHVDARGIVRSCEVADSSGVQSLDDVTCRLALQFGRYHPATDKRGHAIASTVRLPGVRWVLREE